MASGRRQPYDPDRLGAAMIEAGRPRPYGFSKPGINAKLFFSFTGLLAMALALVFICLMALDSWRAGQNLEKVASSIRGMIVNKGKQLAFNTSLDMRSLAEENSISTIREIVASTVDGDSDIVYGIFMDPENKPWVAWEHGGAMDADIRAPLQDSTSRWAASLQDLQYRSRIWNGTEIMEFAAPVRKGDERLGVIRFGLTTKTMKEAIRDAGLQSREIRKQTAFLFLLVAFFAFLVALGVSTLVARRITRPITVLEDSARRMANGDYESQVLVEGSDEIAVLAGSFESMRGRIKGYMHDLQGLVDAKVNQVRSILENIEQGLFTFNLDMEINEDSSKKAAVILDLPRLSGRKLADVLRLTPEEERLFRDWIGIIRSGYESRRWHKISRLAPVHEILIGNENNQRHIVLEYQKILDRNGVLSDIMVLASDVTEARKIERRLQQERILHDKTVKTIFGIASHPAETVAEFVRDTAERVGSMDKKLQGIETVPEAARQDLTARIFKHCHTIKGNAGAFGFESLALAAENFESLLQASAPGDWGLYAHVQSARKEVEAMARENEDINKYLLILGGNSGEVSIKLPESKVLKIRRMAEAAAGQALSPELSGLVEHCRRIDYRSLLSLTSKYRDLVERNALKAGKEAEFVVSPPDLELDPGALAGVDEALVHLLRNAVAHGIHSDSAHAAGAKVKGRIELGCSIGEDGSRTFSIKDNGPGIDIGSLAAKALEAGIVTRQALAAMTDREKMELVFSPGLSTTGKSDGLSGRGLGMSIAAECVRAAGGVLSLESRPGSGTCFTFTLPA